MTGMPRVEVLGLRWTDVDLAGLKRVPCPVLVDGVVNVTSPKRGAGRVIDIDDRTAVLLETAGDVLQASHGTTGRNRSENLTRAGTNRPMPTHHGWRANIEYEPLRPTPAVIGAVLTLLPRSGGPMDYVNLAKTAIEEGHWSTTGVTPWHHLNEDIREEQRLCRLHEVPCIFTRPAKGLIALAAPSVRAIHAPATSLHRHDVVKRELHRGLQTLPPQRFEAVVAQLIARMGFRDVELTRYSGDGGVDIGPRIRAGPSLAAVRLPGEAMAGQGRRQRRPAPTWRA